MKGIKVGRIVYVIYNNSITKEKIYMKNSEGFCFESMANTGLLDAYRRFYKNDEYGTTYFFTLKEAKEHLSELYGSECKLKKLEKGYWEVV